jgi:hypothetical protein
LAILLVAPFSESEQLGSRTRPRLQGILPLELFELFFKVLPPIEKIILNQMEYNKIFMVLGISAYQKIA